MTLSEIAKIRLASQKVAVAGTGNPGHLAGWMGAIQAQDFNMAKWAMGMRMTGADIVTVEKAFNNGEIIRSHLLRPTWHIASREDFRWVLELSAPKIMKGLKYRQNSLGLSSNILEVTNSILKETLRGKQLGREMIAFEFRKAGIDTGDNRLSHILLWAELNGIICSGKSDGSRQTYALLEDRIPEKSKIKKEEAAGLLAKKYFLSHGPATIKDFAWWSGLTAREIRLALEQAGPFLESSETDSVRYWYGKNPEYSGESDSAWLLPAYDELIISYTDRRAFLSAENHKKAVSQNGFFRPALVLGNQISGLWKPVKAGDKLIIELDLFRNLKKSEKTAVEKASDAYGSFLGKKAIVKYS